MKRKTIMKTLLLLAAFAGLACAQTNAPNRYSATTGDAVLSAAATTLTIQKPATVAGVAGKNVALESFTVYCSVSCNVTQAYNGAAATATAATVTPIPLNSTTATATAWSASNVGGGTAVGAIIHVPAGGTVTIDVSKVVLFGAGTGSNYSVTVASITGTANITGLWGEL
jgi:hypothetical protein